MGAHPAAAALVSAMDAAFDPLAAMIAPFFFSGIVDTASLRVVEQREQANARRQRTKMRGGERRALERGREGTERGARFRTRAPEPWEPIERRSGCAYQWAFAHQLDRSFGGEHAVVKEAGGVTGKHRLFVERREYADQRVDLRACGVEVAVAR